MTHDEITARNIVDQYLLGKLSPEESVRFEEHFVDCPACLDQLEMAERFRAALKPLAAESLPAAPGRRAAQDWRRVWPVAAAVVLALGVSLLFTVRDAAMRRKLEQSRTAALDWQRRYEKERAAVAAAPAGPMMASTFYLSITRGSDQDASGPVNRVRIAAGSSWVVLSLEGAAPAGMESLRARIADSTGTDVWRQSGLKMNPRDTLSVILPSTALPSGDYVLTLEGLSPGGRYSAAGRYQFRIMPPKP